MAAAQLAIDEAKLQELLGRIVGDLGAAFSAVLVRIGDELGIYRALADMGPTSSAGLAHHTGLAERYLREWLLNQAAGGYVTCDATADTYELTPEQAAALADDESPASVVGAFELLTDVFAVAPRIAHAFRTGEGVGWHEHTAALFRGTERFFRPGYQANLVSSWIPALDGVEAKLRAGATVADVGCGHGASTIIMAQAFPNSTFVGFDYHPASIERARTAASAQGLGDRVRFEVASAHDYPGDTYDLVAFFDCLHDMGDPVGACRHVGGTLAAGGAVMIVEPQAGDTTESKLNPVGRLFAAASTLICVPVSLSQPVGLALGAQCGEAGMRRVLGDAGFSHVRRATETPFNVVYEARV